MAAARSASPPRSGIGCMALFFGIFALVGGGLFWVLGARPVLKAFAARSWTEVPAVVTSSQVERHSGSKGGSTYNVAIRFDYEFRGQKYHGGAYDFETGSSSGSESKQAVVDRFPVGASTTCWVNPANPAEAVIDRNLGWWIFIGLFPLVFLGAGLGGLVFVIAALRGGPKKAKSTGALQPS